MKMVFMSNEDKVKDFAKRAAKDFAEHDKHYTFVDSNIEAGCLFALRFGPDNDCVVVFRLDDNFEPINYQQLIQQYILQLEN
jgi:CO dehydrogenase/acetyl-CoA synthase beta subunit